LGIIVLLLTCLTQVIAFSYLTVSGKMIAQAVHLSGLSREVLREHKRLKQLLTRYLALTLVSILVVTAGGAVRWRAVEREPDWLHPTVAVLALLLQCLVSFRQFDLISRNSRLLAGTLGSRNRSTPG
jgi:uncharacterized membrane protein YjgN (DUF898 family)